MAEGKLTGKQSLFVAEYLVDLNATQAAIRAGYSSDSARHVGYRNLSNPDICAAIAGCQSPRLARLRANSIGNWPQTLLGHASAKRR